MQHSRFFVGLVVSCGVLFAACSPATPEVSNTPQETDAQPAVESVVAETPDQAPGTRSFELEAFKFAYSSDLLHVEAGDTVTITVTNTGGFHDLVIDELSVATKQLNEGETDTVTFTVPEDAAGSTYEFYCSVANHRALGMVGKLVVEEPGTLNR